MAAKLENIVLDTGLNPLDTATTQIIVAQTEPTTFALATGTQLGYKSWAAGGAFASPVAGTSPTGRKVASTQITDGTITTTGTASWWAVHDNTSLYAHGLISSPQAVTAGNTFTLASFEIKVSDGT